MLLDKIKIRRWKWEKAEYYRAGEMGWFDGQRVELLGGEVIEMAPQKDAHAAAVCLADYVMRQVFAQGYTIRCQLPMDFDARSQPEPDIAVIGGDPRTNLKHPRNALLIVEVADTSLKYERVSKGRFYASRGIADYWIVNLLDRQVEVYREPVQDGQRPFRWRYSQATVRAGGEIIAPLAAPQHNVSVDQLLP